MLLGKPKISIIDEFSPKKIEGWGVGCPSKHKMSQIELLMGDMLCLYVGDPQTKFQIFISIFGWRRSTFVFWAVQQEKRVKTLENRRFLKIGSIHTQKWKRMTQTSTPPFWGVFREVFGPCSQIGALETSFFGT